MSKNEPKSKPIPTKNLFVPAVAVSALAVAISNTTITLLLMEIATTFQVHEGVAAQIRTANAGAELVFALLIGFLAVKFRHKSLLMIGVLLVAVSALGTFFAPTLELMLLFSFIEGSGTVIVAIMTFTIIGDRLSLTKKSAAAIWVVIAGFISTLAGTPTINFIANISNWRFAFLLLVLPISIAGLVLVMRSIPSPEQNPQKLDKGTYLRSFKQIFLNKSAASYLVSSLFFTGIGNAIFAITFFRQQFLLPREYMVYIILVGASLFIIGGLISGKLGNRFGFKLVTTAAALGSGILIILMFSSPNLWTALFFNFVQTFLTAMAISAYACLALDQFPSSRSTMMSLTRIFVNTGSTLAPAIGGFLLVCFSAQSIAVGYQAVGLTYGLMNITAAIILYFFTHDTTKPK